MSAPVLEPRGGGEVEFLVLGHQIHHLPARHARRPGGARQFGHQLGAHERVLMRRLVGQYLEGQRMERIAGQDRGRLVIGDMDGGLAAAQQVVVHGR